MALSAFADKSSPPQPKDLEAVLGKAVVHWHNLQRRVANQVEDLGAQWGFSGKAYGWGLRLTQPKRVVVYLTPGEGQFLASFALGEKAVAAAKKAKLPAAVLAVIAAAKKYAEGRAVRLPVRTAKDVAAVMQLVAIKLAH